MKNRLDFTRLADLDRQFCEFAQLQRHTTPRCGWTKTVRLALGMSSKALGSRLGMTGQGVRKLEQAEADGTITLKTLARLAQGLDCEVRYVLLPRTSLVEQVLTRAQQVADAPLPATSHAGALLHEAETLEAIATSQMHMACIFGESTFQPKIQAPRKVDSRKKAMVASMASKEPKMSPTYSE